MTSNETTTDDEDEEPDVFTISHHFLLFFKNRECFIAPLPSLLIPLFMSQKGDYRLEFLVQYKK
jgi:hypothetical protein